MPLDPTKVRLSEHFLLSDFMGTHSVYEKGYANVFDNDNKISKAMDPRLSNGRALCDFALEHVLKMAGPMSISYGFISPELSRKVVTYQDPDKPSHHRWDLGAAADIRVHHWVDRDNQPPILLAHGIDMADIPYSRIITYSESPYVCVAVSMDEALFGRPRKAFYENRYMGKKGAKPQYTSLATPQARRRHFDQLSRHGLEHDWRGAGHPTYHNGGRKKYQHMQVSKYTVVSDWLIDLQSIANGARNVPSMGLATVQDAFAAAGLVYDMLLDALGINRLSIVAGYVSHTNKYFDPARDWRGEEVHFTVIPPKGISPETVADACVESHVAYPRLDGDRVHISANINHVLEAEEI